MLRIKSKNQALKVLKAMGACAEGLEWFSMMAGRITDPIKLLTLGLHKHVHGLSVTEWYISRLCWLPTSEYTRYSGMLNGSGFFAHRLCKEGLNPDLSKFTAIMTDILLNHSGIEFATEES